MKLSNKYGGLQFFAPPIIGKTVITINGIKYTINVQYSTWAEDAGINAEYYSISSNMVEWNDGSILQYNGVDVLPTTDIISSGVYTTRQGGTTMSKSYDLSTSSKWANLADGEHTVTLRARATNYGTSNVSNSVTVTKGNT